MRTRACEWMKSLMHFMPFSTFTGVLHLHFTSEQSTRVNREKNQQYSGNTCALYGCHRWVQLFPFAVVIVVFHLGKIAFKHTEAHGMACVAHFRCHWNFSVVWRPRPYAKARKDTSRPYRWWCTHQLFNAMDLIVGERTTRTSECQKSIAIRLLYFHRFGPQHAQPSAWYNQSEAQLHSKFINRNICFASQRGRIKCRQWGHRVQKLHPHMRSIHQNEEHQFVFLHNRLHAHAINSRVYGQQTTLHRWSYMGQHASDAVSVKNHNKHRTRFTRMHLLHLSHWLFSLVVLLGHFSSRPQCIITGQPSATVHSHNTRFFWSSFTLFF